MHKRRVSPSPACVPFAWEAKPGLPKNVLQTNVHGTPAPTAPSRPAHPHPAIISFPLCKPPCLQVYHVQGPLSKTPSFNSIHPAPRHGSTRRVRRSSFDNIIFSRSKSGHVDNFFSPMCNNVDAITPARVRLEDDPFLMALQACRKESARVLHHLDTGRTRVCEAKKAFQGGGSAGRSSVLHYQDPGRIRVCVEEKDKQISGLVDWKQFSHHRASGRKEVCEEEKASGSAARVEEGFIKQPPPTTGQLQQGVHVQTRIVQKKRANRFILFFASCFGCH
ncbi:hypothetical protein L7F22_057839 [Adiantum nelumboides]|nr:hypothetical protein [Adiantum nelumboides]